MKLLYCPNCHSIFSLAFKTKLCDCGKIYGRYEKDGRNALISEAAIPLGISNSAFFRAIDQRPQSGNGSEFLAFVISHKSFTVTFYEEENNG